MMGYLILSLFLISNAFPAFAACRDNQYSASPSDELKCKYLDWKHQPTNSNLTIFLRSLFYAYASNGEDLTMKEFFDGMRKGEGPFVQAKLFRDELIRRYTFENAGISETAAIWAMQGYDARMLFLLTQTDPDSVPRDITTAMYLSVYDEFSRYFCLKAHGDYVGMLPAKEYSRLIEILRRMDRVNDPYLKSTNLLYQGIVQINLQSTHEAQKVLNQSREILDRCLSSAAEPLSQKRILRTRAAVHAALENNLEAESDYYRILKIDPNDATALLDLSYILTQRGECRERGVWIEASIRSDQKEYEVVIHCGNQEYPEEQYRTEPPVIVELFLYLRLSG